MERTLCGVGKWGKCGDSNGHKKRGSEEILHIDGLISGGHSDDMLKGKFLSGNNSF